VDRIRQRVRGEREVAPWESSRVQQLGEIAQQGASTTMIEDDEILLAKAIELVKKNRMVSASWLQRKMSLGYPKAAYLIDRIEQMGVVGPVQEAGRARDGWHFPQRTMELIMSEMRHEHSL